MRGGVSLPGPSWGRSGGICRWRVVSWLSGAQTLLSSGQAGVSVLLGKLTPYGKVRPRYGLTAVAQHDSAALFWGRMTVRGGRP